MDSAIRPGVIRVVAPIPSQALAFGNNPVNAPVVTVGASRTGQWRVTRSGALLVYAPATLVAPVTIVYAEENSEAVSLTVSDLASGVYSQLTLATQPIVVADYTTVSSVFIIRTTAAGLSVAENEPIAGQPASWWSVEAIPI